MIGKRGVSVNTTKVGAKKMHKSMNGRDGGVESTHLVLDVHQTRRVVNGKGNEDDVAFRVREGAESVVVFLTGGIPESELDDLVLICHHRLVVLEYGRHV